MTDTETTFNEIHTMLGGTKRQLRAIIRRSAKRRGSTEQEEIVRLRKYLDVQIPTYLDMVANTLDVPLAFCEKAFEQITADHSTPEKLDTPVMLFHLIMTEEPTLLSRGEKDNAAVTQFLQLVNEQKAQNPGQYYRERPQKITCIDANGNLATQQDYSQYKIDTVLEQFAQLAQQAS